MTLDLAAVRKLVAGGESEAVDFKRSTAERDPAARALCAMLNHRGGRVIFGVSPDGGIVGQEVSGRTIERLVQQFAKIDPPVFPSVERVPVRAGLDVIVVTTLEGPSRPYTYNARAWRRGRKHQSLLVERRVQSDGVGIHACQAQVGERGRTGLGHRRSRH